MTYRPFTLEGNFAFAAGIQEMLIQSHTDQIHIFPAIPKAWKEARFERLRTRGGFLVSSHLHDGQVTTLSIAATVRESLRVRNPFGASNFECSRGYKLKNGILEVDLKPGEMVEFTLSQ